MNVLERAAALKRQFITDNGFVPEVVHLGDDVVRAMLSESGRSPPSSGNLRLLGVPVELAEEGALRFALNQRIEPARLYRARPRA